MLRITGGEHRGRRVAVPPVEATRPLLERAREGLMSHLAPQIPGARVWDVFAGSGILGLEVLSRGAAEVLAVERSARAATALQEAARSLGYADRLRVLRLDAFRLPCLEEEDPDLLFLDPPYASFREAGSARARVWDLFCRLAGRLRPGGCAVIHTPRGILREDEEACLPGLERRDYGSTSLYWWHREA